MLRVKDVFTISSVKRLKTYQTVLGVEFESKVTKVTKFSISMIYFSILIEIEMPCLIV